MKKTGKKFATRRRIESSRKREAVKVNLTLPIMEILTEMASGAAGGGTG